MTQKISIVILACAVVLVSAVLSGCGSSNPNTPFPGGSGGGNFGSVSITGSTSATITPAILSSVAVTASMSSFSWIQSSINGTMSVGSIMNTASNTVEGVSVSMMTIVGGVVTSDSYMVSSTSAIPGTTVNTALHTITYANVVAKTTVPGSSNTVIVNGTLKY